MSQARRIELAPGFELPEDVLETLEEQAARVEEENRRATRRARAKRLCGLAALAVDVLREGTPKLREDVEAAIHEVGDGVLALAAFESVVRRHEEPTREQRRAAGAVVEHPQLGWALDKVDELVRAHQRESLKTLDERRKR